MDEVKEKAPVITEEQKEFLEDLHMEQIETM